MENSNLQIPKGKAYERNAQYDYRKYLILPFYNKQTLTVMSVLKIKLQSKI